MDYQILNIDVEILLKKIGGTTLAHDLAKKGFFFLDKQILNTVDAHNWSVEDEMLYQFYKNNFSEKESF